MKKLLAILVLILFTFQTPAWADDITDFQIEGMSVGDSLLDYFSEKEITNQDTFFYKNKKFAIAAFEKSSFEIYDAVQFTYKPKDKKYKIYAVESFLFFKNFNDCYKKKDEIVSELSEFFKNDATEVNEGTKAHDYDKTGNSKVTSYYFYFNAGGFCDVGCYDWSEKLTKERGWDDELRITIASKEFEKFLSDEPF